MWPTTLILSVSIPTLSANTSVLNALLSDGSWAQGGVQLNLHAAAESLDIWPGDAVIGGSAIDFGRDRGMEEYEGAPTTTDGDNCTGVLISDGISARCIHTWWSALEAPPRLGTAAELEAYLDGYRLGVQDSLHGISMEEAYAYMYDLLLIFIDTGEYEPTVCYEVPESAEEPQDLDISAVPEELRPFMKDFNRVSGTIFVGDKFQYHGGRIR